MNTQTAEGITMTDWISDIGEDRDGNIWIVVPNQGLFRYIQDSKEPEVLCIWKENGSRSWESAEYVHRSK